MWSARFLRIAVIIAVPAAPCLAAPLVLYDPNAADPTALPNTLNAQTTSVTKAEPGKFCGDLASPCQNLASPTAPLPAPGFGQGFTYGGSLSTTIGASNHGTGEGGAVTGWVTSPDGSFTLAISAAGLNFNGSGFGPQRSLAGTFGHPR